MDQRGCKISASWGRPWPTLCHCLLLHVIKIAVTFYFWAQPIWSTAIVWIFVIVWKTIVEMKSMLISWIKSEQDYGLVIPVKEHSDRHCLRERKPIMAGRHSIKLIIQLSSLCGFIWRKETILRKTTILFYSKLHNGNDIINNVHQS